MGAPWSILLNVIQAQSALAVKAMKRDFLESPQREIYFYPQAKQAPYIGAIHIQAAPFEVQLTY